MNARGGIVAAICIGVNFTAIAAGHRAVSYTHLTLPTILRV